MSNRHNFTNSSSLSHVDYFDDKSTLEIKFSSGAVHHYADCPKSHYEALKKAGSAGKYFHANIRNKYDSERIDN